MAEFNATGYQIKVNTTRHNIPGGIPTHETAPLFLYNPATYFMETIYFFWGGVYLRWMTKLHLPCIVSM